jgi:hypothetical protein
MKLTTKIGLLMKIRKPVNGLIKTAQEAPDKYKQIGFWATLVGSLSSTVAAIAGYLPPEVAIIVTTLLTVAYNILRGAEKAERNEIKGTFRTTEFWLSAFAEVQKGIMAIQAGGVNPEWLAASSIAIGGALGVGQNLAARNVNAEVGDEKAEKKG